MKLKRGVKQSSNVPTKQTVRIPKDSRMVRLNLNLHNILRQISYNHLTRQATITGQRRACGPPDMFVRPAYLFLNAQRCKFFYTNSSTLRDKKVLKCLQIQYNMWDFLLNCGLQRHFSFKCDPFIDLSLRPLFQGHNYNNCSFI